jgi:hypothetical protein
MMLTNDDLRPGEKPIAKATLACPPHSSLPLNTVPFIQPISYAANLHAPQYRLQDRPG